MSLTSDVVNVPVEEVEAEEREAVEVELGWEFSLSSAGAFMMMRSGRFSLGERSDLVMTFSSTSNLLESTVMTRSRCLGRSIECLLCTFLSLSEELFFCLIGTALTISARFSLGE